MGLFGGTTIQVASSVWNMAGDIDKRINYLKTLVGQSVISNTQFDLTDTLSQGYMNGPGIKARNFCRWAIDNYQGIGIPQVNLGFQSSIDDSVILPYIPVAAGQTATIADVKYNYGDITFWAEQWLMENNPTKLTDTWTVDVIGTAATITYSDTTTSTFTATGFDPNGNFFYVVYDLSDGTGSLGSRLWIYEAGTGHADIDAMAHSPLQTDNTFFPIIPVRLDNNFLSTTYKPDVYALAKKAYKKATNHKIDDLIKQLKDNSHIADIDHIYCVYGCSLNTVENASRKYIFKLFEQLVARSTVTMTDFNNWLTSLGTYTSGGGIYPYQPYNQIEIKETGTLLDTYYHIIMSWSGMSASTHAGLGKPEAKPGDVWFQPGTIYSDGSVTVGGSTYSQGNSDTITMAMQIDANNFKVITVANLLHENLIYKDKSVKIKAIDALADADESGFIVPLSYEIQREMSLIDSTQMMTSAMYLVMNSYVVKKLKWYQTGIFKIIVFIAIIAITVATGGAGAIGLLGTNFAVGSALGFSGLAATIVGAVANALAAMILIKIIDIAAVAAFGPKLGALIAAVVSVIAMQVGTGLMNGMNLSSIWGNMMSAQNLIGLTSSVGNGFAGYIQASAQGFIQKSADVMTQYQKESKNIQEKFMTDFGGGAFGFDPMSFTDFYQDMMGGPQGNSETVDQFLQRTLMTGTDIAQMSLDMLTNYADITTDTRTMFSS